ncbi:MAG: UDP-N-acetylmuramoyl-tripeptide--D-alanyl-D-alanine ligase [Clostridia bacterium]|nr:UDP-N-acetylmuramoyl-tripeptide--D-alanyl-D-alanine ligase [Clostridia bacterium]
MKIDLGYPLPLKAVAIALDIPPDDLPDITFTNIATDASEVKENGLFLAIVGERHDGHDYIRQAIQNGAKAVLAEKNTACHCPTLLVPRTTTALGKLAFVYSKTIPHRTIAITGSVGKTTTRSFIEGALSPFMRVHATLGNYNSQIGLPMTMLAMPPKTDVLVLELGMNHMGEMRDLSHICEPDMAVITNVGHAHIGHLGTKSQILKEKWDITAAMKSGIVFRYFDIPIINYDLPCTCYTCAIDHVANYRASTVKGLCVRFSLEGNTHFDVNLPSVTNPYLSASLYTVAVCHQMGLSNEEICQVLPQSRMPGGRLEEHTIKGIKVINDAYNASPESMLESFRFMSGLPSQKRRMAWLGDMRELGEESAMWHAYIGQALPTHFDHVWLEGEMAEVIAESALSHGMKAEQIDVIDKGVREETIQIIASQLKEGDALLIKGAHAHNLMDVAQKLINILQKEKA